MGILVGFLGGYTTFSSYSLESLRLLQTGEWLRFALYFGLSPVLGLGATFAGLLSARALAGAP